MKLSYMPFIVKACSMALLHFPILNSSPTTWRLAPSPTRRALSGWPWTRQGSWVPNIKSVQTAVSV